MASNGGLNPGKEQEESGRQTRDQHLQTVSGLPDRWMGEGRVADSPLTLGPQRCYQPDPAENPSRIPAHSSLGPASFTASPQPGRCLWLPILQPLSQSPKGIWLGQEAEGLGGRVPAQPSFEPCCEPEGRGWDLGPAGGIPSRRDRTPQAGPPSTTQGALHAPVV